MSKAAVYDELVKFFSKLIKSQKMGGLGEDIGLTKRLLSKLGSGYEAQLYSTEIAKRGGVEKAIRSMPLKKAEALLAELQSQPVPRSVTKRQILSRAPRKMQDVSETEAPFSLLRKGIPKEKLEKLASRPGAYSKIETGRTFVPRGFGKPQVTQTPDTERMQEALRSQQLAAELGLDPLKMAGLSPKERSKMMELPFETADVRSLQMEPDVGSALQMGEGVKDSRTRDVMKKILAEAEVERPNRFNFKVRKGVDVENLTKKNSFGEPMPIRVSDLTDDERALYDLLEREKASQVGMGFEPPSVGRGKRSKFQSRTDEYGDVNRGVFADSDNAEALLPEFEDRIGMLGDPREIDEFLGVADKVLDAQRINRRALPSEILSPQEFQLYNRYKVSDVRKSVGDNVGDFLSEAVNYGKPGGMAAEELAVKYPNMYSSLMSRMMSQRNKNANVIAMLDEQGLLESRPGYKNKEIPMLGKEGADRLAGSLRRLKKDLPEYQSGGGGLKQLKERSARVLAQSVPEGTLSTTEKDFVSDLKQLHKDYLAENQGKGSLNAADTFEEFVDSIPEEDLQDLWVGSQLKRKGTRFVGDAPRLLEKADQSKSSIQRSSDVETVLKEMQSRHPENFAPPTNAKERLKQARRRERMIKNARVQVNQAREPQREAIAALQESAGAFPVLNPRIKERPIDKLLPEQIGAPGPDYLDASAGAPLSPSPLDAFLSNRAGGMASRMYQLDEQGNLILDQFGRPIPGGVTPEAIKRVLDKRDRLVMEGTAYNPSERVIMDVNETPGRLGSREDIPAAKVMHDPEFFSVKTREGLIDDSTDRPWAMQAEANKRVGSGMRKLEEQASLKSEVESAYPGVAREEAVQGLFDAGLDPFEIERLLTDPRVRASLGQLDPLDMPEGISRLLRELEIERALTLAENKKILDPALRKVPTLRADVLGTYAKTGDLPMPWQLQATAGQPVPNLPMLYSDIWSKINQAEEKLGRLGRYPTGQRADLYNL